MASKEELQKELKQLEKEGYTPKRHYRITEIKLLLGNIEAQEAAEAAELDPNIVPLTDYTAKELKEKLDILKVDYKKWWSKKKLIETLEPHLG